MRRGQRTALLLICAAGVAAGLEARWTPAADGGPARFSKRYRDAAGIDDSRWHAPEGGGWGGGLFPQTTEGWLLAAMAIVGILILLPSRGPATSGGARAQEAAPPRAGVPRRAPGEASAAAEAARKAFLRRFD